VIRRLIDVARRYPADVAPRIEPPAVQAEVADLEEALGEVIPEGVLRLFRVTRAIVAMDIRNGCWIGGPQQLSRSIRRSDFPGSLNAEGRDERVLPIATDGGGNAFLLTIRLGSVWRWDHETGGVACVSSTIADFLGRVAEDWAHNLEGDAAWRYLF
jgi:cell wall assembly regulator SMI1